MNANVKCFILCIYKTILKPSKQFLTVSNHKVFSLHALWMTILRPSRQLLTVSNHQVFRFYTLLKLSKVFHPSICSSFVLNLRWLLLRVSRWITNMLVLSKYLLTVFYTSVGKRGPNPQFSPAPPQIFGDGAGTGTGLI